MSDVNVAPLGNGRYGLVDGPRRQLAHAVATPAETWVFLDGQVFVIVAEERAQRARTSDDLTALVSPMPATVIAVNASQGDSVSRGDVLIVLEAMKMELPIRSPRDGRVKAVRCRIGELVQPGVLLVELD